MVIKMKEILTSEQLSRTLKRMTHEIIEAHSKLEDLILVGILKKGLPIANIIKENLKQFAQIDVPVIGIDITNYRDDVKLEQKGTQQLELENKNVILVDDVLYTGRSVRAAMDAIMDHQRPSKIQLAVLVDRGHRELPIRADFVGKNIPTSKSEKVIVDIENQTVYID